MQHPNDLFGRQGWSVGASHAASKATTPQRLRAKPHALFLPASSGVWPGKRQDQLGFAQAIQIQCDAPCNLQVIKKGQYSNWSSNAKCCSASPGNTELGLLMVYLCRLSVPSRMYCIPVVGPVMAMPCIASHSNPEPMAPHVQAQSGCVRMM